MTKESEELAEKIGEMGLDELIDECDELINCVYNEYARAYSRYSIPLVLKNILKRLQRLEGR